MNINRMIVIVLDGVGAGEAPDAADFGDLGSNSLGNTALAVGGLNLPNMQEIGLGNITGIAWGIAQSRFSRCLWKNAGKVKWKRFCYGTLGVDGDLYTKNHFLPIQMVSQKKFWMNLLV